MNLESFLTKQLTPFLGQSAKFVLKFTKYGIIGVITLIFMFVFAIGAAQIFSPEPDHTNCEVCKTPLCTNCVQTCENCGSKLCQYCTYIKGNYPTEIRKLCQECLYEEEVDGACGKDSIWNYVAENMTDFYLSADIQTNNIKITLDQ